MEWRQHPKLKDRFHPDMPDDLQVLVHDGGPRLTQNSPEMVWATVTACKGGVFSARILNTPHQLESVAEGSEIQFIAPSSDFLLMVTDKYLSERPEWSIQACNTCGLDELFDAPSDLIKAVFPDIPEGASMGSFTTFCGACGGVQLVRHKSAAEVQSHRPEKKWWQFWK